MKIKISNKIKFGKILYHFLTCTILVLFFISFVKTSTAVNSESELVEKTKHHWLTLKKNHMISGSILITKNQQVIFSDGDLNQSYMIGSLSKSFIGYYFFKHPEYLDTVVCDYITPFCDATWKKLTIRNLLQHKNGFKSFFELRHTFYRKFELTDLDSIDITKNDFEKEKFENLNYSNLGYDLLSRVIEKIEKKSFSEVIQNIGVQAALKSTSLLQASDQLNVSVCFPYLSCAVNIPFINMNGRTYGSGGIISTAQDIQKWIQFLNHQGVMNEIENNNNKSSHYDFGMVKTVSSVGPVLWHNGAILGYRSLMLTTKDDLQIVILANHMKPFKFFEDQFSVFENLFKPTKKEKK